MGCHKAHIVHLGPSSLRSSEIGRSASGDVAEGRKSECYHKEKKRKSMRFKDRKVELSPDWGCRAQQGGGAAYLHVMTVREYTVIRTRPE